MKNYLVFDVETDGLYGKPFAFGAVVVDREGNVLDSISGIQAGFTPKNVWVVATVLPVVKTLPKVACIFGAFWNFYLKHQASCTVWADFGTPVESNFVRLCVEKDLRKREWEGPYPLHEIATLFLSKGFDPDVNREEFIGIASDKKHNPIHDALTSAKCIIKLIK